MEEDNEIFKNEKDNFQYTGDLKKYNMLPNNYQKISYKKLEEKVDTFYDGEEDESNLSTKLNSKNSNSNNTNENSNQNNQILNNNNNNVYINSNNTENKEKPVELKVDKKNNSFISEKIEPNFNTNQNNQNLDLKNFLLILYNRNIMKQIKLFFAAMLAMSLTLVGCKDGDSGSSKQDLEGYIKLGVTEFHNAIDKEKEKSGDVQILDYRSEAKYKEGHIPGAINIDASNAADWKDDNGLFMLKKNNKKKLIKRIKKNDRRREKPDEIRIRIKNKFHKFSFNYLNYLIREENKNIQKIKFRKIEYNKIFGGNKKQNKEFLQKKFKDLIEENNITPKYKNKKPELNKKHLKNYDLNDNLCNNNLNESKVFNFLNLKMELIFNDYFLNKKPEKDFLNQKRKKKDKILFFDDFIEELKDKKEDENYIEKVKEVAKNYVSFYNNVKEKDESISSKKRNLFYIHQCK